MSVTNSSMSITELDDDSIFHIFKYISLSDRLNLELVCKKWQEISSSLWKTTFLFNVKDEQELGYELKSPGGFGRCPLNDINVSLCKQVFIKSSQYLTRINLSRVCDFENMTLLSSCYYCSMGGGIDSKPPGTLNDLLTPLLDCENIEELSLCRCVIEVDDDSLGRLFQKNKRLHSIALCAYQLVGECFIHLNLRTIESINFKRCSMKPSYLNSVIFNASKLHTLSISSCEPIDFEDKSYRISTLMPLKLVRLNVDHIYSWLSLAPDIYKLENLTILIFGQSNLNDQELKLIVQKCAKLVVLHLMMNDELTDDSLCSITALPKLENLDIGFNQNYTDAGLHILSKLAKNVKFLDVSMTDFSEKALLSAVKKMPCLEQLNVGACEHLGNSFVKSLINVVRHRRNNLPLELGVFDSGIDMRKIKNTCQLVRLVHRLDVDYKKYY